jgi:hypothetical protein
VSLSSRIWKILAYSLFSTYALTGFATSPAPVSSPPELASLRDIHLPPPIGLWPLAKGWYILSLVVVVLLLFLVYAVVRFIQKGRGKRQALRVLQTYQLDYLTNRNTQVSAARISELLRRVALVYYPREAVASLQGQAWIDFLNQNSKNIDFNPVSLLLLACPYQPMANQEDLKPLFQTAKQWIKQRRGQCLN